MFGTPDFGQSDLWHFNFALKSLFSVALKSGYFPFWSKDIGMGFPLLAEGQIGMFYLPNLLFFRFFGPVPAFNLSYFFIFATTFLGSFLFGKSLKLRPPAALLLAFVFTFSGVMVTQVPHLNLVQAVSWLPWQFLFVEKLVQSKKIRWSVFLAVVFAQQILASYQQIVLISIIGTSVYLFFRLYPKFNFRIISLYFLGLLLGLLFSLPQLLPSWQLVKLSFRNSGTGLAEMVRFPFHPKNLLSFLNPYFFGDPRAGTYPPFSASWGIFWESTGYVGLAALGLALLAVIGKKSRAAAKPFIILGGLGLVLLLGKYTPAFFLFQLPPLDFFRVPARFLILFAWTLAVLAAVGFNRISNRLVLGLIGLMVVIDLGNFALNYNALINPQKWLAAPESVEILRRDPAWFRVFCPRPANQWNNIFLKTGWRDMDQYLPFRNCLDSNQNLYWGISVIDTRQGMQSRRMDLWQGLVDREIAYNNDSLKVSSSGAKLLSLAGAKYLISQGNLASELLDRFTLVATTSGDLPFTLWQNLEVLPHAYLTNDYLVVDTVADLTQRLADPRIYSPVMEENLNLAKGTNFQAAVVKKNSDLEVIVETDSPHDNILVLSDTYYPSWQAEIDGQKTKILPANLVHRAVLVPAGKHEVRFTFQALQIL